ncbi:MAG: cytochrome c3 family protein [Planctomycetota bacterium]|nr:cytochrome c3 family protein [Planctomycetota bacterium]
MNYWELGVCLGLLLLAFAAASLNFHARSGRGSIEKGKMLAGLAIGTTLFLWMAVVLRPRADEQINSTVPQQDLEGDYVSSTSCRSCHPGEHRSWHDSYHRSMTMVASREGIKAPFDGRELALGDTTFKVWQEGDEFWVRTPDPDLEFALLKQNEQAPSLDQFYQPRQGPAPPLVDRRVVMTTGSHSMQMFWLPSAKAGQDLRLFPWVYFIPEKQWIPYEDSFIVDPRYSRPAAAWNRECIICHSVNGNPRATFKRIQNRIELDTSVAELGIACEACHGPAADHIKRHSNPLARYQHRLDDIPDSTIFNPATATQSESSETCAQCHSWFMVENMQKFLQQGSGFRPGKRLSRTHQLAFYDKESIHQNPYADAFWPDGSVRTGGREYLGMAISACFQKGTMTCLDCHSMHQSTDPSDQLTSQATSNLSCLRCHDEIADSLVEHTHHLADSEGSRCYNCHMPHTSFALMGAIRSHRVDSPRVVTEDLGDRPNACNLCHLDKTLEWTSDHLVQWYGHPPAKLEPEQREVAASVRWILGGNGVQRAISAWHMGWEPALEASGQNWQLPLLNIVRTDDFSVNRFVAQRAMKAHELYQPLRSDQPFDFIGKREPQRKIQLQFLDNWQDSVMPRTIPPAVLQEENGKLQMEKINQLINNRDNRPIVMPE